MNVQFTWIDKYGHIDIDQIFKRYIYSLYFAVVTITTVGYGDITPANEIECFFLIVTLLISSTVYAFLINSIGSLMENMKLSFKLLIED